MCLLVFLGTESGKTPGLDHGFVGVGVDGAAAAAVVVVAAVVVAAAAAGGADEAASGAFAPACLGEL